MPGRQHQAWDGFAAATLIVFVGVFDGISTNASLAAGNAEANGITATFQQNWGDLWFILKLIAHIAMAMVILWLPSRRMIRGENTGRSDGGVRKPAWNQLFRRPGGHWNFAPELPLKQAVPQRDTQLGRG